jgi:hypothetical protein
MKWDQLLKKETGHDLMHMLRGIEHENLRVIALVTAKSCSQLTDIFSRAAEDIDQLITWTGVNRANGLLVVTSVTMKQKACF